MFRLSRQLSLLRTQNDELKYFKHIYCPAYASNSLPSVIFFSSKERREKKDIKQKNKGLPKRIRMNVIKDMYLYNYPVLSSIIQ